MQIRELDLKELYPIYDLVAQLYTEMSYQEFEDIIYEMRHMEYKMLGIFERGDLVSFAGVCIHTNLRYKRHLMVYEFVTSNKYEKEKYDALMHEYLRDFAKMAMCERIVYASYADDAVIAL